MQPKLKESPIVSVIVPTYKRADRLEVALRSIKEQTYQNLEILVVNDNVPGSDWDYSTVKALEGFDDPRLKVVHTAGQTGGGAARNYACRHALGEYLAFLDDDDEFLSDKVETQLALCSSTVWICVGRTCRGTTRRASSWSTGGSTIARTSPSRGF